jgi:hypothetical protein
MVHALFTTSAPAKTACFAIPAGACRLQPFSNFTMYTTLFVM